jgi:hypothetical protein
MITRVTGRRRLCATARNCWAIAADEDYAQPARCGNLCGDRCGIGTAQLDPQFTLARDAMISAACPNYSPSRRRDRGARLNRNKTMIER